jgi:hypothetical protein
MTASITLAVVLALTPLAAAVDAATSSAGASCSSRPPATIRVFRIHRRGTSIPARVDRVPFRLYVERVMDSGAWPAHKPMESLKAGALVIMARAHWLVCHPQRGYRWRGVRYDIHDGSVRKGLRGTGADAGQLYRGPWRIHSRIRRAVDAVWGYRLRRGDRMAKPQWSGDAGPCVGNRLPEERATRWAKAGWTWRRIIAVCMPRTRVVR